MTLKKIGNSENFVKGIHSVGDFDPEPAVHHAFPAGGSRLEHRLGLRRQRPARARNVFRSAHRLLSRPAAGLARRAHGHHRHRGHERPDVTYITAAMPSACGKTNLAMMESALPEYKIYDDRRRHRLDERRPGRPAVGDQSRSRVLRRRSGDVDEDQSQYDPDAAKPRISIRRCSPTSGSTSTRTSPGGKGWRARRPNMLDWQGRPWTPSQGDKAAHPNSRFTVSLYNCPTLSKQFDNPQGVPISAILLGGRRSQPCRW